MDFRAYVSFRGRVILTSNRTSKYPVYVEFERNETEAYVRVMKVNNPYMYPMGKNGV